MKQTIPFVLSFVLGACSTPMSLQTTPTSAPTQKYAPKNTSCTNVLTDEGYECLTTSDIQHRGLEYLIPSKPIAEDTDTFKQWHNNFQYECSLSQGVCSSEYLNRAMVCIMGPDSAWRNVTTKGATVSRLRYRGHDFIGREAAGNDHLITLEEAAAYAQKVFAQYEADNKCS